MCQNMPAFYMRNASSLCSCVSSKGVPFSSCFPTTSLPEACLFIVSKACLVSKVSNNQ